MEKIEEILEKFGVKKNEPTSELQLYELFEEELKRSRNNDLLDELIFPNSPLLSIKHPRYKSTVLHEACFWLKDKKLIEKLISCGANINAQDENDSTPLYWAMDKIHKNSIFLSIEKLKKKAQIIKIFIKNKANIHIVNKYGDSVLHSALRLGLLEIVEMLLENYKLPKIAIRDVRYYSQIKIKERFRKLIMFLIEKKCNVNHPTSKFSTLLEFIVRQKDEEFDDLFEYTVKNTTFNVNALSPFGESLLHIVAEHGTPAMIDALIAAGADINIYNNSCSQRTPIFRSILNFNHKTLKSLLDNGACVDMVELQFKGPFKYIETNTPLHYAVRSGDLQMIKMLVEKGANINALSYHRSPLLIACGSIFSTKWKLSLPSTLVNAFSIAKLFEESDKRQFYPCDVKIVEYLLDNGADIEAKNPRKRTALDQSCKFGNLDIVNLLLSRGAKIKKRGFTTLHYAITGENPDVVKTIVEKGVNVNYRCTRQGTPLQYTINKISNNCAEIVKILILNKADVNLPDKRMNYPLHLAFFSKHTYESLIEMSCGQADVIGLLLNANANINDRNKYDKTPLYYACRNYILMRDVDINGLGNPYEPDLEVLVAFLVEKRATNKYVSDVNLLLLGYTEISKIYEKYYKESNCLKEKVVNSLTTSFLDILSMDINYLGGFLRNDGVVEALNNTVHKNKFPLYGHRLIKRVQEGDARQKLNDFVVKVFWEDMKVYLPYEVIIEIFGYLDFKDMGSFFGGFVV